MHIRNDDLQAILPIGLNGEGKRAEVGDFIVAFALLRTLGASDPQTYAKLWEN